MNLSFIFIFAVALFSASGHASLSIEKHNVYCKNDRKYKIEKASNSITLKIEKSRERDICTLFMTINKQLENSDPIRLSAVFSSPDININDNLMRVDQKGLPIIFGMPSEVTNKKIKHEVTLLNENKNEMFSFMLSTKQLGQTTIVLSLKNKKIDYSTAKLAAEYQETLKIINSNHLTPRSNDELKVVSKNLALLSHKIEVTSEAIYWFGKNVIQQLRQRHSVMSRIEAKALSSEESVENFSTLAKALPEKYLNKEVTLTKKEKARCLANNYFVVESNDDNILYIRLDGFQSSGSLDCRNLYAKTIAKKIESNLNSTEILEIVFDLRFNSGGSVYPMVSALSTFIDRELLLLLKGNSSESRISIKNNWLEVDGDVVLKIHRQKIVKKKHIIALCDGTASSGEALAMILRGKGDVLIGLKSAGLTTSNEFIRLPKNNAAFISTAKFHNDFVKLDPSNKIIPDVTMDSSFCGLTKAELLNQIYSH